MSQLSEMVVKMSQQILELEREVATQSRRAQVAEARADRLTSILAMRPNPVSSHVPTREE